KLKAKKPEKTIPFDLVKEANDHKNAELHSFPLTNRFIPKKLNNANGLSVYIADINMHDGVKALATNTPDKSNTCSYVKKKLKEMGTAERTHVLVRKRNPLQPNVRNRRHPNVETHEKIN
ncbi:9086_t:CDS:2, partial [Dentiscutata erythropus]